MGSPRHSEGGNGSMRYLIGMVLLITLVGCGQSNGLPYGTTLLTVVNKQEFASGWQLTILVNQGDTADGTRNYNVTKEDYEPIKIGDSVHIVKDESQPK